MGAELVVGSKVAAFTQEVKVVVGDKRLSARDYGNASVNSLSPGVISMTSL